MFTHAAPATRKRPMGSSSCRRSDAPAPASASRLADLRIGVLRNPRSGAESRRRRVGAGVCWRPIPTLRSATRPTRRRSRGRWAKWRSTASMHDRGQRRRRHRQRGPQHGLRAQSVRPPAAARRTARRHREHDGARRRHAGPPGSRTLRSLLECAARGGGGLTRDRASGHAHRRRVRSACRSTGCSSVHRPSRKVSNTAQAGGATAGPARRDRTSRDDGSLRRSRWLAASAPCARCRSPSPSTTRPLLGIRDHHVTTLNNWSWAFALLGRSSGPLRYAACAPARGTGSRRSRPPARPSDRYVTKANGYSSRNATGSSSDSTATFFVDGEILHRRRAHPDDHRRRVGEMIQLR